MKIIFYHDRSQDDLTLRLSNSSGVMVNGTEADSLAETDPTGKPLRFEANVSESLNGWYTAQVYDARRLLYTGRVRITGNDSYLIDDPAATVADLGDVTLENVTVESLSPTALQQLAGKRQINITIPTLLGKHLTDPLIQGDSYTADLGSAIEFARSDFPNVPSDATATLTARKQDNGEAVTFTISGDQSSIPVKTGTKVVRFEPTSEQTRLWSPGKYEFDVEITFPNGEKRTFIGPGVYLRVLADVA